MVNFAGYANKVSKKLENIKELVPDIGAQIQADFNKFANELDVGKLTAKAADVIGGSTAGITLDIPYVDRILGATASPNRFSANLDARPGPVGQKIGPGQLVPGKSQPPWPNELEGYASMNCIITLSALTVAETNDPDGTYRKDGIIKNVIARSGGAGPNKVLNNYEKALGKKLEFFIDDLDMEMILTPSTTNRNTNATKIDFKILEPYSMGLFLNSLKSAATVCGYANYIEACFMLTLEFVGTDENGSTGQAPYSRRQFPIKFRTVEKI